MSFKVQHIEKKTSDVSTVKVAWYNKDLKFFGSNFGPKKKERFYQDLKTLLAAGVDLRTTLEIIIEEQDKEKEKLLLNEIYLQIVKGKSLSMAMNNLDQFTEYEFYCIKVGEEANKLVEVLQELVNFYTSQIEMKKQITSVLSYPLFVFGITIGLVYFMLTSVVPMFADVFKQFGSDLPKLTQKVIKLSENFPIYLLYFTLFSLVLFLFFKSQRSKVWYRSAISTILIRIPIVGSLISAIFLARFTQSLYLLLSAKTPLIKSLELTSKLVKFYPIQVAIKGAEDDIRKGKSLYESLAKYSFFPKRMMSLIKVGEQVNQLDIMLGKLSKQYSEELKYRTTIIGKIMEPLILLIIGGIVGVILVAMYMPMFNLSNVMTQ